MKFLFSLLFVLLLLAACGTTQPTTIVSGPSLSTTEIITEIASDKYEGRESGTPGYNAAATYVADYLSSQNIQPYFANGYFDSLTVQGDVTYNVVGLIGEKKPGKEYILIGAHLDHLGLSDDKKDGIYNGANDDASGVTAVLRLAAELSKETYDRNVIVALFAAEEKGLKGSAHLAERLQAEGINLKYMLNFEMLGKTLTRGENSVYITGYNRSDCAAIMNELAGRQFVHFLQAEISYSLFSRSDNFTFFNLFRVPAHTVSTFDFENYDYYHKVQDEVSELDLENMDAVIESCIEIVKELLRTNRDFTLKE